MVFYNYFHSTGRRVLIDALACPDPFGISPREIVERILAAGYKPHVASPSTATRPSWSGSVATPKRSPSRRFGPMPTRRDRCGHRGRAVGTMSSVVSLHHRASSDCTAGTMRIAACHDVEQVLAIRAVATI